MNRTRLRQLTLTAICIALGVVLPVLFHSIPRSGQIFLPMHLPVLLAGLLAGPGWGMVAGILTPLISTWITGMPPIGPILFAMLFELAAYGLVNAFIFSAGTGYGLQAWMTSSFVTGLPGIALQLVFVPLLYMVLAKAKLTPSRQLADKQTA
ncbi:MAG: ECF transporter S component [Clostridiaceae bacterium]|nr:ECF transporter S component [Clostridiaceae bacterium]